MDSPRISKISNLKFSFFFCIIYFSELLLLLMMVLLCLLGWAAAPAQTKQEPTSSLLSDIGCEWIRKQSPHRVNLVLFISKMASSRHLGRTTLAQNQSDLHGINSMLSNPVMMSTVTTNVAR